MSFKTCMNENLAKLGEKNKIAYEKMRKRLEAYDALYQANRAKGMDDLTAAGQAALTLGEEIRFEAEARAHALVRQAQVQSNLNGRVVGFGSNPRDGIVRFIHELDGTSDGWRKTLHGMLWQMVNQYGIKWHTLQRNTDGLDKFIDEIFHVNTGDDSARAMAKAVRDMEKLIVKSFNTLGIKLREDANWRLPQMHNPDALQVAGRDVWVRDHLRDGVLDWDNMNAYNAGRPIPDDPAERRAILESVWDTLVSDGASKLRDVKGADLGKLRDVSFAKRIASKRFLRYKSSAAWQEMNGKYGAGNAFSQIVMYVDQVSRDLALATHLGPDPRAGATGFENAVLKTYGVPDPTPQTRGVLANLRSSLPGQQAALERATKALERLWRPALTIMEGNAAGVSYSRAASALSSVRNVMTASLLGGTPILSVPSDMVTLGMRANLNGMPAGRFIGAYARMLNPANEADRRIARRVSAGSEGLIDVIAAQERFTGDVMGPTWSRMLPGKLHRLSGLTQTTQIGRNAWALEFQGFVADNARTPWTGLPDPFRRSMEVYGIDSLDWDRMRSNPLFGDVEIIRFADILDRDDIEYAQALSTFTKFSAMMSSEMNAAIPSSSLLTQASLLGGSRPGTFAGELTRTVAFLKSFPLTMLYRHIMVQAQSSSARQHYVGYLVPLVTFLTLTGALSTQMQSLLRGYGPAEMNPFDNEEQAARFWGTAVLRGGGLGILGDFLFSDLHNYGGGLSDLLTGPVVEMANDLRELAAYTATGNEKAVPAALRAINNWAPGTRLWYLRLVKERMLMDYLNEQLDPNARARQLRTERRIMEETGAAPLRSFDDLPGAIAHAF